jgi:hypothetical protein
MICFNTADYNLSAIKKAANISRIPLKEDFRVYGIRQGADEPMIYIRYVNAFVDRRSKARICGQLDHFFQKHGLRMEFEEEDVDDIDNVSFKISIGLRKDVRKHIELSVAIIKTIVYAFDGRLNLNSQIKPKIPD